MGKSSFRYLGVRTDHFIILKTDVSEINLFILVGNELVDILLTGEVHCQLILSFYYRYKQFVNILMAYDWSAFIITRLFSLILVLIEFIADLSLLMLFEIFLYDSYIILLIFASRR